MFSIFFNYFPYLMWRLSPKGVYTIFYMWS